MQGEGGNKKGITNNFQQAAVIDPGRLTVYNNFLLACEIIIIQNAANFFFTLVWFQVNSVCGLIFAK